ncbi:MAG: phosphatase PAP2 family protein [Anaerolineales bacterium]|jgi:membrane-associated phospholipid phosphatase
MEGINNFGVDLILFLQGIGDWLDFPMLFFSYLGNEEFFLLVMPAVYWCVSSTIGLRLGLLLLFSATLNSVFKLILHGPRPYWYSPEIRAAITETSFGAPSGHSQNAAAVWGGLASAYKQPWLWMAAAVVIFFTGISRLYVGVHFPQDVLSGWLLGLLILLAYLLLEERIKAWWQKRNLVMKLLAAFLISLSLIGLGVLTRASLSDWTIPQIWVENAASANPDAEPINPLSLSGIVSNSGALFGLIAGVTLLPYFGGFNAGGAYWKRAVRFVIGVIGVLLIWRGLGVLLPGGENMVGFAFRYFRYALIGGWISGLAPIIFTRTGLADGSNH